MKLPMQANHLVLANLRAAWTAASRKNQHHEGNRALAINETDLNAPLDTGSRNALQTAWRAQPIVDLPATWQAPEGCIGAFYRTLERCTITGDGYIIHWFYLQELASYDHDGHVAEQVTLLYAFIRFCSWVRFLPCSHGSIQEHALHQCWEESGFIFDK